ncbi:MAG: hypothetical protein NT062_16575, partial [Proteobacteria bacterium]|nr:hypothetical protein [Pseudomonadota bacterium]
VVDAPPPPPPPPASITPDDACARLALLRDEGCAWASRFPGELADPDTCIPSVEKWFAPETPTHAQLARMVGCWALACDDASACMAREQSRATPSAPRSCGDEGTSPIFVDAATWAARRGADARRFGDVTTSVTEPLEVCGVEGEVAWMTRATCKDGRHPFATEEAANEHRDSWMARGGRCNSILDRYTVACPEATYTIHVDRYVCPR